MPFKDVRHVGMVSNYTGNGIHCRGAYSYFPLTDPFGQIDPYTGQVKVWEVATSVGFYSSSDDGSQYSEIVLSPTNISISANEAKLSNITVWSANSILTQGRGNSLYIADTTAVLVPVSYGNDLFYGHYQTKNRAGAFPYVSGGLMLGSNAMVGIANQSDPCNIEFSPGDIFNVMRFRSYNKSIVINNDGFSVETGTANWYWSANTILTQGRGDARYQPVGSYLTSANLTWSNITGKPTFATVATSGNYNDLSNKPASYTLPAATNSTLGGIIVGSGLAVANGVLSSTTVNIDGGSASSTGTGSFDGGSATTN